MSRFVQRSAFALGMAGILMAAGPALADAPLRSLQSCAPSSAAWASDRAACRVAARVTHRRVLAGIRTPYAASGSALGVPSRYVSLLILGVGY
ncbi:hypothetical protein [Methylobacterium trifolii]|uniref:Uncharacterized protein n=1 Tax=Methylobacterium trifolii TaxID=1003092 RepID=A0ABQ4TXQ6_9HYPH|nr:hypothetical protein [Methylobacterium trifolii]GJE59478.1 hypothetical protein MPOCJGCO_1571 [Methylobacterium trifolii]